MVRLGLTIKVVALTFFTFTESADVPTNSAAAAPGPGKWLDNYETVIIIDYDNTMVPTIGCELFLKEKWPQGNFDHSNLFRA